MVRAVVSCFLAFVLSSVAAGIRYCNGDLVFLNVTELTGSWPSNHSQLSARLRVSLRPDRTVSKIAVEQTSDYREVDAFLIKHFSQWRFLKATNCDVVLIPVRVTVKREKT